MSKAEEQQQQKKILSYKNLIYSYVNEILKQNHLNMKRRCSKQINNTP